MVSVAYSGWMQALHKKWERNPGDGSTDLLSRDHPLSNREHVPGEEACLSLLFDRGVLKRAYDFSEEGEQGILW